MTDRKNIHTLAALIGVVGISVVFFWPFRNNFFIFDDFFIIESLLHGPVAVIRGFNNIFRLVSSCFQWILFWFSGHDPFGYSMFSLTLYASNGVLFYFLCKELLDNSRVALLAALLFASSAVGCDAVIWKAAYATLLSATFYLLTLLAYVHFRKNGATAYYRASIVLFLLALLSKEESASLPFIILAMEMLCFRSKLEWSLIKRVIPYAVLIAVYILVNYVIIYHLIKGNSELVKHSGFRPLHTLLAPWTAFFIAPDGHLAASDIRNYLAALLIPVALAVSNNRRHFLFALAWLFLAFLPQSLSTLSQFEPKYLFNSISRHLYFPSAGAALALALLLERVRALLPTKAYVAVCAAFLTVYIGFNYSRVQQRGNTWAEEALPNKTFLTEIKKILPELPPNTHVLVIDPPTGRHYMQLSLRAFYMNKDIAWIVDPEKFVAQPGMTVYLISCLWLSPSEVKLDVNRIN